MKPLTLLSLLFPLMIQTGFAQSEHYQIFPADQQGSQRPLLSRVDTAQLIYGDEQWVVVGNFVRDQSAAAYHYLDVYRSNTLELAYQLKILNYVIWMDWSPERKQFLAVTTSNLGNEMLVKWPDDEPGLILIEPDSLTIEKHDCEAAGDQGWITWNQGAIELTADRAPKFSKGPFRDIRFRRSRASPPKLSSLREEYIVEAGLDFAGLDDFSEEHHTWYNTNKFAMAPPSTRLNRFIRTTGSGHAIDLDLSTLRSRRIGDGRYPIDFLTIFGDGSTAFASNQKRMVVNRPNGERSSINLDVDWGESMSFDFSSNAGYLVGPHPGNSSRLMGIRINENGAKSSFSIPVDFRGDLTFWSFYPKRGSVGKFDMNADDRIWQEYSWSTGQKIGSPHIDESGKGMGAWGRLFGEAPEGWEIQSTKTDSHTGGYESTVNVIDTKTGTSYEVATGEISQSLPLHLFNLTDKGFMVLCTGNHKIYLYQYRFNKNSATLVKEWDRNPGDGDGGFNPVNRLLYIPRKDSYELYRINRSKPRKLGDLYLFGRSEYAVVLRDGYYTGSPGCESFVKLPSNGRYLSAAALAPWRNRPGKVLSALGGDSSEIDALEKMTDRWLAAIGYDRIPEPSAGDIPSVDFSADSIPLFVSGSSIELSFSVSAGASPIKSVELLVNGVAQGLDFDPSKTPPSQTSSFTVTLPISRGQQWVELSATDTDGRKAAPARFRFIGKQNDIRSPRKFVVALGVSDYQHEKVNDLNLAAKDARDMAGLFKSKYGTEQVETLVLTDQEATRDAMVQVEEFLSAATVHDEIVFFAAGHGVLDPSNEYVFLGHDADPEPSRFAATGIPIDMIVSAVKSGAARKTLILLDTCQSGLLTEREMSQEERKRYIEDMFRLPGMLRGLHMVGGSAAKGVSLEIDGIENGLFTHSIIEALDGKADFNRDGRATIDEIKQYLVPRVVYLSGGKQQPSVVSSERDQAWSFPVPRTSSPNDEGELASTRSPVPPIAPLPTIAPLEEDDVRRFVISKIKAENSGNLSTIMNYYGANVDYHGEGRIPRYAVQEKKQDYFSKYSKIKEELASKIAIAKQDSYWTVVYLSSYSATNRATRKTYSGKPKVTLVVQESDGQLAVVYEKSASENESSSGTSSSGNKGRAYRVVYTGSDGVNMRNRPGGQLLSTTYDQNAAPFRQIPGSSEVIEGGLPWIQGMMEGWMAIRKDTRSFDYSAPVGNNIYEVTWNGGGDPSDAFISLRSSYSSSSTRLAKVYRGTRFQLLDAQRRRSGGYQWVKVRIYGWMARKSPKGTTLMREW